VICVVCGCFAEKQRKQWFLTAAAPGAKVDPGFLQARWRVCLIKTFN
jgi:hypothetical protein